MRATGTFHLKWGTPPKPFLWKLKITEIPKTAISDLEIDCPLLKTTLYGEIRLEAIPKSDYIVAKVALYEGGTSWSGWLHKGDYKIHTRDCINFSGSIYSYTQIQKPTLQRIFDSMWVDGGLETKLKPYLKDPNVKMASSLSEYRIDPRFIKPAPKKMVRTAGEVRFVKDNSNDAGSWAWGDTGASERRVPADYVFKKRAQKELAKTMRSSLSAMGHALSAYHTFTKIKSAEMSPDGALGGRGYIQKVAHMRRAYMNVVEALSALSDTLYDEINAPHWGDISSSKELKNIVEDAEEIRDDPEGWAKEQEGSDE